MDDLELLIDLHRDAERQGPGTLATTLQALALTGLDAGVPLQVADIGCGTGPASLALAASLPAAQVTAIDFLPPFLAQLQGRAAAAGLSERITPLAASMAHLPLADATLDLIWSEGAIYNIGFAAGIRAWRRFLKPGGVLAISELTWLTAERPAAVQAHWQAAYPEVDTAGAKIATLEAEGFSPMGYFVLPASCWREAYYGPMEARFPAFLDRHGHSPAAQHLVAEERAEIALFERFSTFYGYGFYLARKVQAGSTTG